MMYTLISSCVLGSLYFSCNTSTKLSFLGFLVKNDLKFILGHQISFLKFRSLELKDTKF